MKNEAHDYMRNKGRRKRLRLEVFLLYGQTRPSMHVRTIRLERNVIPCNNGPKLLINFIFFIEILIT